TGNADVTQPRADEQGDRQPHGCRRRAREDGASASVQTLPGSHSCASIDEGGEKWTHPPSLTNEARTRKDVTLKRIFLVIAVISALAFACKKTDEVATGSADTATAASTSEISGTTSPNDLNPVKAQSYIDDVTIGHEVAAGGTIPAGKTGDQFTPGQKIIIAMKVKDAPANTAVKVVFNGPPDKKVGEETKNVPAGATFL